MKNWRNDNFRAKGHGRAFVRILACVLSACVLLGYSAASGAKETGRYLSGKAALRSGDYEKARKSFEAGLNDGENSEALQAGLLQVLRETGDYADLIRRAEEFLASRPRSSLLHLERGRIAAAVSDYAGAEKHFRQAGQLAAAGSAVYMEATRHLAEVLEATGRRGEAQTCWNHLIGEYRRGRVQGSQSLGAAAIALWRRGSIQDAKDVFLDATDSNAGEVSLETLADFGYLFLDKYNATEALNIFRDCLKINRFYPKALTGIAMAKRYDSDFEAATYAMTALNVNPNYVPARNLLAELAIESEDLREAQEHIQASLQSSPVDLEALSLQAVCFYLSGRSDDFAAAEKKILTANKSYGRLYYILAENLVSRRKYQEAVDFNRKAVALDPELWAAYVSLGMNLTRTGQLEEGRRAIQTAFDGDGYNVWAFNSLNLLEQMNAFAASSSAHFRFLMSEEDAPVLSIYAAGLAEEVYAKLTQRYGFAPRGPLQIEIFPDHGGFAVRTLGLPGLSGALGVCFGKVIAIDSPRARRSGAFNWGSTLWHEFAHVISLQMSNHNIPRWYSEGISVYEENRARPGWGDNLTLSFIKAYKEGKLLKASELNNGFVRPKNPEQIMLSYYQAGLVCQWIEETFGFDKIPKSLLLFAENKSSEEVFLQTLGLNAAGMDAAYARFLDTRFKNLAAHVRVESAASTPGAATAKPDDKEALRRVLQNNPNDFFANLQLGTLLLQEGADAEAEALLKRAQEVFPRYVGPGNPYQLLGQRYQDLKRDDEALAEYVAWSRQDGGAREPLLKAADIYRSRKEWDLAAKTLALSLYINPYDQDVLRKLSEAAMEAGNWPEAVSACRALTGLNPVDAAGAHYDLARALLGAGNLREAKRAILRALEIAPAFRKAQQLLLKISESQKP